MFKFLKQEKDTVNESDLLNELYVKLKEYTKFNELSDERKSELRNRVFRYGYLPYPHLKALEELSAAETLVGLEVKWENNNIFKDGKFCFENNEISPLARNKISDSNWIKREGHDLKLINLAALGNGNYSKDTGKFFDWLKQTLTLPTGNLKRGIFNTTVYLTPFHPREFGCAYLPTSSEVSPNLNDKNIENTFNLDAEGQVKLFIKLTQLAGHPVIYDILPQTGRFAKNVLANPSIVRWFDIKELSEKLNIHLDSITTKLSKNFNAEDVSLTKNLYKQALSHGVGELSEKFQEIFNAIDEEIIEYKKELSDKMTKKSYQAKLHKKVREIVAKTLGTSISKIKQEKDITRQNDIIQALIAEGIWSAPGGAWCSCGVPVFDKMSDCGSFPVFKHFDCEDKDVTAFANLDCQTPYYFVYLENGTYNMPVINYYVNFLKEIKNNFNFDGFRVDHVDHIVDKITEQNGKPISYRAPKVVLDKVNVTMKKETPYFACLAEYMLWDKFYKEYHQDMHFDILWGNDIISQSDKTPTVIVEDNQTLTNYNVDSTKSMISILKTYNNQDGEFTAIDRYPAQLQESGALFKWFKYKFLPGGKFAQRPIMYVDGDESFTQKGIEETIGNEISMKRGKNYYFYNKFDAVNRLSKEIDIVADGEAQIITQEDDGFVTWIISKETSKNALLVIANYHAPQEKFTKTDENGNTYTEIKHGTDIYDKAVTLPCDYKAIAEYVYSGQDFEFVDFSTEEYSLHFDKLHPAQFKIFLLQK